MDSHALKISGKAELPEPVEIGHNFRILAEGSVDSSTKSDNHDGTFTFTYLFKPVKLEAITSTGKTIKAKDTRSRSKQLRAVIYRKWQESNEPVDEEAYYDKRMVEIIQQEIDR